MTQLYLGKIVDFPHRCCYPGATSRKGELVVPTLGFILCAYLVYALIRVLIRRAGRRSRHYRPWRRRRLTMVSGAGVGVGFLILIAIAGLPAPSENFKFAGIISPGWGEDLLGSTQTLARQEILPLKNLGDSGQPIYAYLHPETPPPHLARENGAPLPRPLQKSRLLKPAAKGKIPKAMARMPKNGKDREKDKVSSKNPPPKKKKTSPTAGKLAAKSG